jgi:hypothetical protein
MNRILRELASRRVRTMVQVIAVVVVSAAGVLSVSDSGAARVVSTLVLGTLAVVALKLSLVLLQRHEMLSAQVRAGAGAGAVGAELRTLATELDENRSVAEEARAEVTRLAAEVEPLIDSLEHQQGLLRRTEPAIAEFATLRHEVLYLRETLERLRTELGR